MTADDLAAAVGREAGNELASALGKIKHCLGKLSDEQVWRRSRPSLNSIGNLILHLCGNVRQWIVAGLGAAADSRDRPAEFAERGPIPTDELLRRLEAVVDEARAVLARQSAQQLLAARRIQGFDVTGLAAIFDSVPHFRGHTQEVVSMKRPGHFDLRRFTPKVEVDLCGHATLASAHVLWQRGLAPPGEEIPFSTRSSIPKAAVRGQEIELDFPL